MRGASEAAARPLGDLLARKGQARPAMTPHPTGELLTLPGADADVQTGEQAPPAVLTTREMLVGRIAAESPVPVSAATAARIRRETRRKGTAAFTLRLDEDRHLRLRLASVTRHRSAQQLVTEALDALLATLPEVDALVAQLPPAKR